MYPNNIKLSKINNNNFKIQITVFKKYKNNNRDIKYMMIFYKINLYLIIFKIITKIVSKNKLIKYLNLDNH